jgi:ketosteroid isomerase-like protein
MAYRIATNAASWLSAPPGSAAERQLVNRLTRAFEAADVDGIIALLAEDVWLTMPPLPLEYQGRELAARFTRKVMSKSSSWRW